MEPLKRDTLSFRSLRLEDAELLFDKAFSDSSVTEFLQWDTHSNIQETEILVTEMVRLHTEQEKYFWIASSSMRQEPIGLGSILPSASTAAIGFLVFSHMQGKGYGSILIQSLCRCVSQRYKEATACVHPDNYSCLRLLRRLGWTHSESVNPSGLVELTIQSEQSGATARSHGLSF